MVTFSQYRINELIKVFRKYDVPNDLESFTNLSKESIDDLDKLSRKMQRLRIHLLQLVNAITNLDVSQLSKKIQAESEAKKITSTYEAALKEKQLKSIAFIATRIRWQMLFDLEKLFYEITQDIMALELARIKTLIKKLEPINEGLEDLPAPHFKLALEYFNKGQINLKKMLESKTQFEFDLYKKTYELSFGRANTFLNKAIEFKEAKIDQEIKKEVIAISDNLKNIQLIKAAEIKKKPSKTIERLKVAALITIGTALVVGAIATFPFSLPAVALSMAIVGITAGLGLTGLQLKEPIKQVRQEKGLRNKAELSKHLLQRSYSSKQGLKNIAKVSITIVGIITVIGGIAVASTPVGWAVGIAMVGIGATALLTGGIIKARSFYRTWKNRRNALKEHKRANESFEMVDQKAERLLDKDKIHVSTTDIFKNIAVKDPIYAAEKNIKETHTLKKRGVTHKLKKVKKKIFNKKQKVLIKKSKEEDSENEGRSKSSSHVIK